ncbi:hypothetical protein COU77_03770 [Candidatus Peregrinibacteria bacterium CG10_big_fil_rev_8_21_14_0_10_49_16]|nr:MAG: hypothetical protein COW95_04540 [Candidatus Peregrinibacteria bacterium CG22_combo_CG10-13_8_21_14_all_49_11]PIR51796.1 MAG: hypothetical protein COU77_03770 [Candidatus Peregrinibacteria bacterium CG10_big_fil_rev_8_21_14_0_10_49_16]
MKEIRIILGIIIAGLLFVYAFFILTGKQWDGKKVLTLIGPDDQSIDVRIEVASDPALRSLGLMNRTELAEDAGMLFVFDYPQVLTFWMKNTLIPLDILFFDEEGNFVGAKTMEPCTIENCPTYSSEEEARYALELNKNFVQENGIGKGWKFSMK